MRYVFDKTRIERLLPRPSFTDEREDFFEGGICYVNDFRYVAQQLHHVEIRARKGRVFVRRERDEFIDRLRLFVVVEKDQFHIFGHVEQQFDLGYVQFVKRKFGGIHGGRSCRYPLEPCRNDKLLQKRRIDV